MGLPPDQAEPFVLQAPPAWRCIDFISDLHLQPELPRTAAALEAYLQSTPADAVLILGDLFEAWVGDDAREQPFEARCVRMLAAAGQRLYLAIMVGNRDFLLGAEMVAACQAQALPDPCILEAWGQRALLIHGDAACLDDTDYLRFRGQVRQAAWQRSFLAQPLEGRLAQARQMREVSAEHQRTVPKETWADVSPAAVTPLLLSTGSRWLIHGHTHRPGSEPFGPPGCMRHVLSDWDLDDTRKPRSEVLRWQPEGFSRIAISSI